MWAHFILFMLFFPAANKCCSQSPIDDRTGPPASGALHCFLRMVATRWFWYLSLTCGVGVQRCLYRWWPERDASCVRGVGGRSTWKRPQGSDRHSVRNSVENRPRYTSKIRRKFLWIAPALTVDGHKAWGEIRSISSEIAGVR